MYLISKLINEDYTPVHQFVDNNLMWILLFIGVTLLILDFNKQEKYYYFTIILMIVLNILMIFTGEIGLLIGLFALFWNMLWRKKAIKKGQNETRQIIVLFMIASVISVYIPIKYSPIIMPIMLLWLFENKWTRMIIPLIIFSFYLLGS